jgi:hypothetical protein
MVSIKTVFVLECGDQSPLWSAATSRSLWRVGIHAEACGVKPPLTKALTGQRTPKQKLKVS